jgi:pantothenate kinase type III
MLLAVDVGNTRVHAALIRDWKVVRQDRETLVSALNPGFNAHRQDPEAVEIVEGGVVFQVQDDRPVAEGTAEAPKIR